MHVPVLAACPVLCSGNGQYSRGRCQCYSGWKGTECDVPANQCIDIHCGGHGICIMGACICNTGYKGDNCEEGKNNLFQKGALVTCIVISSRLLIVLFCFFLTLYCIIFHH